MQSCISSQPIIRSCCQLPLPLCVPQSITLSGCLSVFTSVCMSSKIFYVSNFPSSYFFSSLQSTWSSIPTCRIRHWESEVADRSHHRYHPSCSCSVSLLHRGNNIRTCPFRSYRTPSFLPIQVFPSRSSCKWWEISSQRTTFPRFRNFSNRACCRKSWTALIPDPRSIYF